MSREVKILISRDEMNSAFLDMIKAKEGCQGGIMEKKLEDMTNNELKNLIAKRYNEALNNGIFDRLATIAQELGQNTLNNGSSLQWTFEEGNIRVSCTYCSPTYNCIEVTIGGRMVASNREYFIVSGDWLDELLKLSPEAQKRKQAREEEQQQAEREELLSMLVWEA